jgi:hypothetical protein
VNVFYEVIFTQSISICKGIYNDLQAMFATSVKCADFGYLLKCLPVINTCFIALTVSLKQKPMAREKVSSAKKTYHYDSSEWQIRRKYSRYPVCSGVSGFDIIQETETRDFYVKGWKGPIHSIVITRNTYSIILSDYNLVKIRSKLNNAGWLYFDMVHIHKVEKKPITFRVKFNHIVSETPEYDAFKRVVFTYDFAKEKSLPVTG